MTIGTATNIIVNSFKLIVASDADFSNILDEVSVTFVANSTLEFSPTSGEVWSKDAYYKFIFNVTVSGTSNKYIEFSGAKFYGVTLPTVKCADYIIDLGPDGGDHGGSIVCCGTPEEVVQCPKSITGLFLKSKI